MDGNSATIVREGGRGGRKGRQKEGGREGWGRERGKREREREK